MEYLPHTFKMLQHYIHLLFTKLVAKRINKYNRLAKWQTMTQ